MSLSVCLVLQICILQHTINFSLEMLSVILNVLGFVSIPAGPFTYSEAVFASTHNSYSGTGVVRA